MPISVGPLYRAHLCPKSMPRVAIAPPCDAYGRQRLAPWHLGAKPGGCGTVVPRSLFRLLGCWHEKCCALSGDWK
ncbi:MAG: hypothetical protein ACI8PT_001530 [Gammaproteobacteria bacterium]|jgi:hypothetical protein